MFPYSGFTLPLDLINLVFYLLHQHDFLKKAGSLDLLAPLLKFKNNKH